MQLARSVDPATRRVLHWIDRAATATGLRYFVAGATARDLILVNVFGMPPGRATRDIDFGIAVKNWDDVQELKDRLLASSEFEVGPGNTHQLLLRPSGAGAGIPIDFIPFGGVESGTREVAWPPSHDVVMNVAGFEEALESSVRIKIENELTVSVASIPGLAILKLLAWLDRRNTNNKDATDLRSLLVAYATAGNLDRIYDQELGLLEEAEYDIELAGSQLLGRDAALTCLQETHRQAVAILSSEQLVDQLIH